MKNSLDYFNDDDNEIFDYIAGLKTVREKVFAQLHNSMLTQSEMYEGIEGESVGYFIERY